MNPPFAVDSNGNINATGNFILTGEATQKIFGDGGNSISIDFSDGDVIANIAGGRVASFVELVLTDGTRDSIFFGARKLCDAQGNDVLYWDGDVRLAPGRAVVIPSPNGTLFRCTVDNNGNWINVALP